MIFFENSLFDYNGFFIKHFFWIILTIFFLISKNKLCDIKQEVFFWILKVRWTSIFMIFRDCFNLR